MALFNSEVKAIVGLQNGCPYFVPCQWRAQTYVVMFYWNFNWWIINHPPPPINVVCFYFGRGPESSSDKRLSCSLCLVLAKCWEIDVDPATEPVSTFLYHLYTNCVPVVYQGTWSSCEKKRNWNFLGQPSASPLHPFLYLSLGQTSEVFILIYNILVSSPLYQDLKVFQSFHLLHQQKIQSVTHLRAYVICWL